MRFVDKEVRRLNPRQPQAMIELIELLCGWKMSPPVTDSDKKLLGEFLRKATTINYEQFNEVLLVLNQERISRDFFDFFFQNSLRRKGPISLSQIKKGVEKFRGFAMLCFGNFRFAFRRLSWMTPREFCSAVGQHCVLRARERQEKYHNRPKKTVRIDPVPGDKTWYVGYLTESKLEQDISTFLAIQLKLGNATIREISSWIASHYLEEECKGLDVAVPVEASQRLGEREWAKRVKLVKAKTKKRVQWILETARLRRLTPTRWASSLWDVGAKLSLCLNDLQESRELATKNTAVYLTWDYMDVYVATSMRERWEYETTFEFLKEVFKGEKRLQRLKVRYFDPTQSYSTNRIDKGLVEALMLRRAHCTLYLAQETETLGKDSELASTLAQGKPVIAYVPAITDVGAYARRIRRQPLDYVRKRWLQLEVEEIFTEPECLQELERRFWPGGKANSAREESGFLEWKDKLFGSFRERVASRTFSLIEEEERELKSVLGQNFAAICNILAVAEKHYFNKRARTLRDAHPLAIQVDLETGVANGVLVARSAQQCSRLIYGLLTNDLSFHVVHGQGVFKLVEDISGCPYRIVTEDPKLTNSFWNFYLTCDAAWDKKATV